MKLAPVQDEDEDGQPSDSSGKQPKDSQFDKVEDAKLFPHSKNSSIYEPRTARPDHEKGVEAQRCRNEKSLEPKQNLNFPQPEPSVQSARGE